MAPMSLVTYEETRPWAKSIRQRVITRQMPPWHIDKTVGVQQFKNDMSLSDEQIAAIVKWVDAGAPLGNPKDMPAAKQWPAENEWKAAKELGQPDLVIKSEPYTMAAHHQDVWWRPVSDIPLTEPRWVRAVEMRPGTLAGRRITHHAVTYLAQDDPESIIPGSDAELRGRALLMEWAVGKGYDLYRPDTGKLILPGSQISWDIHIHAVGEAIRDHVELGIWLYPKGQEPKHRTYLTAFQAVKGRNRTRVVDIPPNSIVESQNFTVLPQAAQLENFQPHMHLRGKAMEVEAILPDGSHAGGQLRRQLQLQLDDELHLRGRCRARVSQRHDDSRHRLVRQHHGQPEQSRSGPMGRLRRPHGRRDGARLDERHLSCPMRNTKRGRRRTRIS